MGGDTLRVRVAQFAARLNDGVRTLLRTGRSRSPSVEISQLSAVVITAVVVTAVTVAIVGVGTQSAMAVSATASDITVSSNDGNLTAVTMEPELTVSWSNINSGVTSVSTTIDVSNGGTHWERTNTFPWDCEERSNFDCGETSYTVDQSIPKICIAGCDDFRPTGPGGFELSDFNADDGETTQTDVHVRLQVSIYTQDSRGVVKKTRFTETFTVTVENLEGEMSASATLNTNAATPTQAPV